LRLMRSDNDWTEFEAHFRVAQPGGPAQVSII
jgi:hypothetical protein